MSKRIFTEAQAAELARRNAHGASLSSLAREHGTNVATVRNTLRRIGHSPHYGKAGGPLRNWSDDEVDNIVARYAAGESQESIAAAHKTTQVKISRLLRTRGGWDGRRQLRNVGRVTLSGYSAVLVYPDDPFSVMRNSLGYVLEHRLVLARALGRPLTKVETVHHKNGDKTDNRLENLELRVGPHGRGSTEAHCPTCSCFGGSS